MKKLKKVEIYAKDQGIIIIDGEKFKVKEDKHKLIDGHWHEHKATFVQFDEKEFDKDLEFIIDNIEHLLTKREIMKEILKHIPISEVNKIKNRLKKGAKITKTEGCITINIGKDCVIGLVN